MCNAAIFLPQILTRAAQRDQPWGFIPKEQKFGDLKSVWGTGDFSGNFRIL